MLQVELKVFNEREAQAVDFFMFSAAKASERAKARLVSLSLRGRRLGSFRRERNARVGAREEGKKAAINY